MSTLHDKIIAMRDDLRHCLLERENAIDIAILALLCSENAIYFGPPGTGKSMLVRALCARIDGAQYFEKAMSPVTTPEDIYGPIDIQQLSEHGLWVRRDAGSMSKAHIAFLDEITRSNEAVRDTLLVAMNERLAQVVGFDPYKIPLRSLFSAANHSFDEESEAFNDRFLLREVIQRLSDESNFLALVTGNLPNYKQVNASITLDDLDAMQEEISKVRGTKEVLQALLALKNALLQEGIDVSDRRWAQCGKLLKAFTWYQGESVIQVEHLACFAHALWNNPKDAKTVQKIVYGIACPLNVKAMEILDMAEEVYATLPKDTDSTFSSVAENVLQQLADQHKMLQNDLGNSAIRDTTTVDMVLSKIAIMHKAVSTAVFKNMSRFSL